MAGLGAQTRVLAGGPEAREEGTSIRRGRDMPAGKALPLGSKAIKRRRAELKKGGYYWCFWWIFA
jgi:hypothetical protein